MLPPVYQKRKPNSRHPGGRRSAETAVGAAPFHRVDSMADVVAGLSIAGLLLPEAVAYSTIANLPPQAGIIGLIAGLVCYAVFGKSRFAVVSATSSSAAVVGAAAAAAHGDPSLHLAAAAILVMATGAFFLLAAALRFGNLSDFIAKPVLRGFAFGLALVIIAKQLPVLLGVSGAAAPLPRYLYGLMTQMPQWNPFDIDCGALALGLLIVLARFKRVPGALIVIFLGIASTHWLDLARYGVPIVGSFRIALNVPALGHLEHGDWLRVGELSLALVLVLYAESSSSIRSFAIKHGDATSPNRDLLALGIANLASGIFQGMPVGAGYSATSANEAAGALSGWAGAVAAAAVLVMVFAVLPMIALTPTPVLAAIVIYAVGRTLNWAVFEPYLLWHRDRLVLTGAALSVLAFGVLNGLIMAVAISLAMMLRRLAQSNVAELGRLGTSHDFVDRASHPHAQPTAGVLVVRAEAPLFFANAERMLTQVRHRMDAAPGVRAIVLSLEETPDLDGTAIEALQLLANDVAHSGRRLILARLKEPVIEVLSRAKLESLPDSVMSYFSVDDAVAAALDDSSPVAPPTIDGASA